jgi:hypothetical protein
LRVLRIGVGNDFVLVERGLGLAIVLEVLGQPANRIKVVAV